jgi:hypothetical protein
MSYSPQRYHINMFVFVCVCVCVYVYVRALVRK